MTGIKNLFYNLWPFSIYQEGESTWIASMNSKYFLPYNLKL